MLRYVAQRIALSVPVFLGVITIVFLVVRVLPGDPAQAALGDYAPRDAVEALRSKLGLDAPLPVQYAAFLFSVARGDLGTSLINGTFVRDEIAFNLPYTLALALTAMVIGISSGVPLGALAAMNRNRLPDAVVRVLSLAGLSLPAFYLGILLMLLFGVQLRWLPTIGGDGLAALVLPSVALGLLMTSSMTRVARTATLGAVHDGYVRTARAKGLRERAVLVVHTLRPALLPIVSLTGIWAVALIGDSVTTEVVFSRPGLGKMMVGAMLQRDYTSVQSVMVIYTAIVVGINLIVDLAYGAIEPRIRTA